MEKPILIHSNEILLVAYDDDQHMAESGPLDANQVQEIIDGVDDVIQILCVKPYENSCEDISEEIAELYVKANIEHLDEDSKVHYFIRESDAYNRLLDDIADEKYKDEIYGTYEEQHRLTLHDVIPNYSPYRSKERF